MAWTKEQIARRLADIAEEKRRLFRLMEGAANEAERRRLNWVGATCKSKRANGWRGLGELAIGDRGHKIPSHARLLLFSIRQHLVDACDDLPRVLDRSLALPDLVQEALTFFLRFFDQRRRRIEWYGLLLVHCPAPDQARLALLAREAALRGQTR